MKHNDLLNAGIKHNLFLDAVSTKYNKKYFEIWQNYPIDFARKFGCDFTNDTPKQSLKEIFVEGIYKLEGFLPKQGDIVVDAGANYGDSAIWYSKCFGAKVIAFEPLTEVFDILLKNIELNKVNVEAYNKALGNGNGLTGYTRGGMFISNPQGIEEAVESAPLDSFYLSRIDLLKIDVEGFELEVLEGAANSISTNLPKIILETHSAKLRIACNNFLKEYGYEIVYEGRKIKTDISGMDNVQNLFYST